MTDDVLVSTVAATLSRHLIRYSTKATGSVRLTSALHAMPDRVSDDLGYVLFQLLRHVVAKARSTARPGSNYARKLNSREIVRSCDSASAIEAEQTAIAAILSDMDAEIAALEAKLAKARQIKQGMMQELLTGRIRLI